MLESHDQVAPSDVIIYLSGCAARDELFIDFVGSVWHLAEGAGLLEFLDSQPEVQIFLAVLRPQEVAEYREAVWAMRRKME